MRSSFITAALIATAALATLAGGVGIWAMLRDSERAALMPVQVIVGERRLQLDAAYLRATLPERGDSLETLDIVVDATTFRPRGQRAPGASDAAPESLLFVTLRPQDRTVDPADRPMRLYARFLERDSWTHDGGLVMRRFEPGGPFANEELYMAPPEGRLFAARCTRPRQPPDGVPDTCLADIRLLGIDVTIRFRPERLGEWDRITTGVRALVQSFVR